MTILDVITIIASSLSLITSFVSAIVSKKAGSRDAYPQKAKTIVSVTDHDKDVTISEEQLVSLITMARKSNKNKKNVKELTQKTESVQKMAEIRPKQKLPSALTIY